MMPRLLPLLALAWLSACQSLPARSPAAELAIRDHNQANAALARGDLDAAEAGFRAAMRQAGALDDWQGEAESRLALALTLQRKAAGAAASELLQPLLHENGLPYSRDHRRQAALRQAQWQLAAADWQGLRADLALAGTWCDDCRDSMLHRLRAQLALQQGELAVAWREAGIARAQARDDDQRAQAARVQANIAIAEPAAGRHGSEGRAAAEAALDMDRRLGNSVGIFQDLLLRTWLAHLHGDADTATWLRRTCEVGRAAGQPALLQQLRQLPEEIWHATVPTTPLAGTAAAPAAVVAGDCRQP